MSPIPTQTEPVILVLEISNPTAASGAAFVALGTRNGDRIDHEPLSEHAGGRDDLHPAIERLCERSRVSPKQLGLVAVSVGPGGYTGLRVAVAAGKLICEATGARAVSIPTPRLVARSVEWTTPGPRGIALASKGDACHLTVQKSPDEFFTPGIVRADDLERFGLTTLIGDSYLPEPIGERADDLGITRVPACFSPEAACRLASEITPTDPDELSVCYAREPDAVTQWRARSK